MAAEPSRSCPYPEREEDEGQPGARREEAVKCERERGGGGLRAGHAPSLRATRSHWELKTHWALYYSYPTRRRHSGEAQKCEAESALTCPGPSVSERSFT